MNEKNRPYIFISYAHKDSQLVLPVIEGLKKRGFHVWYDAGIQPGTEWSEVIARKIYESNCMIAFVTDNVTNSTYCPKEIGFAIELKKEILTVYTTAAEKDRISLGLKLQLNNLQAIFIENSADEEKFLDTLSLAEVLQVCRFFDEEGSEDVDKLIQEQADGKMPDIVTGRIPAAADNSATQGRKLAADSSTDEAYTLACDYAQEGKLDVAFNSWLEAARNGHPDAMYQVAECYQMGRGTERQESEAYHWYRKAAELGVTKAMLRQGQLYEMTNGTRKGCEKGFWLFSVAAKLGEVEAMYELGKCYLNGIGTAPDKDAGIEWLQTAAEQEDVQAMYELGMTYIADTAEKESELEWEDFASAQQRKEDRKLAMQWFDSAAYWRHPGAMYELGKLYEADKQFQCALQWYERAAEKGHTDAIRALVARMERDSQEGELRPDAIDWYRKAAELGDVGAMHKMAEYYARGVGIEQNEHEAMAWHRKAAENGNAESMYRYGEYCEKEKREEEAFSWYQKAVDKAKKNAWMLKLSACYASGIGTREDRRNAFIWCKRAAEEVFSESQCGKLASSEGGNLEAMFALAQYYERGYGTGKDETLAVHWYQCAAHQGHSNAQYHLAKCFEEGRGTNADMLEATRWCLRAAENNCSDAMVTLAGYYENGTAQEYRMIEDKDGMYERIIVRVQSPEEAFIWYQKAANVFNVYAMYKLGVCYEEGIGTPADQGKAEYWLSAAANHDYADASFHLARIFEKKGSISMAEAFYSRAAAEGHPEAEVALATLQRGKSKSFYSLFRW